LSAGESTIVDVAHTDVERLSIGDCWLYAEEIGCFQR
jgi:hypothetical protein